MAVNLYTHQREAIEKLHTGAILYGGVGSGKSRAALAYFCIKDCNGKVQTRRGEKAYMKDPKDLYIITTPKKRDSLEWEKEAAPFLLSTFGINLVVDSWNNIRKYVEITDAFFIFDEQRVVGYGSWVKSFLRISRLNHWILLSATPGDVWMDYVPVFIANGFYRNKTEFIRRHVVYDRYSKYPRVDKYLDTGHLRKLRDQIVVSMPCTKKSAQHHEWVKIGYNEDLYEGIVKDRWNPWQDRPIRNRSELVYLLRKAVNDEPKRLIALSHIFDTHHRLIVFYNFDYELLNLKEFCKSNEIIFAEWNGHHHQPIPTSESWMYLVQYNAGSDGWNCIVTDTVVFLSTNYSYRSTVQAAGRIDRINTPFADLYYYHLFSDSKIDQGISRCLKKKKNFNESTFIEQNRLQEKQSL